MDHSKEIIKNLSLKYRIPEITIKLAVDHVLSEVKNKMGDENLPEVLIHNLGRFQVNKRYLSNKIKGVFRWAEENDGRIEYYERLQKYVKAYRRICKEDNEEFTEEFINIENKVNSKLNETK